MTNGLQNVSLLNDCDQSGFVAWKDAFWIILGIASATLNVCGRRNVAKPCRVKGTSP